MLVYMLMNTVTERCYVGATNKTLEARWKAHKDEAKAGSTCMLHRAMREWDEDDLWLRVVLCNAYDMRELTQLEEAWIELTWARDQSVGYNGNSVPYSVSATNGMSGGRPEMMTATPERPASPLAGLTDEQKKEFYREQGRKGAQHGRKGARPRKEMTEEERERYREWGRKGAARSRQLAGKA